MIIFWPAIEVEKFFSIQYHDASLKDRVGLITESRRTWAGVFGGIGIFLAVIINGFRAKAISDQAKTANDQLRAVEKGQITERYTRAIELLGTLTTGEKPVPHVVIRLGGVYALEQIAKDDPDSYLNVIVDVLAAYLRESTADPMISPPAVEMLAAAKVLSNLSINFSGVINLKRTNLEGVNLQGANLESANLRGANLQGANLRRANLQGAILNGANLGEADLEEANLQGANGLTTEQLCEAENLDNVTHPDGILIKDKASYCGS